MQINKNLKITLGEKITVEDVVAVARYGCKVKFSDEYCARVTACRKLVNRFSDEERVIYGITTGLGDNWNKYIDKEERKVFQRNIVLSHATSLGEPLDKECVRAAMLIYLQHLGSGHTGIRLETLEVIRDILNADVTPFAPKHGSVGYIGVEGHIASVIIGEGQAYYKGTLMPGSKALMEAGIRPTVIESKEGLSLISGTTSPTALAALAVYDSVMLAKTADISGSMSLEVLKGTLKAMDPRLMKVRPHPDQAATAYNIRKILAKSEIQHKYDSYRVQDALSLRCMPQLHGAAKKLISDAMITVNTELNSSVDNPQIFETGDGDGIAIMGCNADAAYIGTAADTLCIAIANLAKMSERRLDRMVNSHVSELPAFLSDNPGLNNGLMIPQYAASGIMGEIRLMSQPATVDNLPTCALQEDYVSMGYNAALKAYGCASLAKYIFAIELMNSCQAQDFYKDLMASPATSAVHDLVRKQVPFLDHDRNMHGDMEYIADLIRNGKILNIVESVTGTLKF